MSSQSIDKLKNGVLLLHEHLIILDMRFHLYFKACKQLSGGSFLTCSASRNTAVIGCLKSITKRLSCIREGLRMNAGKFRNGIVWGCAVSGP